jgi:2-haloacid dehalogenase
VEPKAVVFDAYGTLFDVGSVARAARAIAPDPEPLVTRWRERQLEYTWLRSLMGRFEDFWTVTRDALRFSLRNLGIPATEAQIETVLGAYLTLSPFPEVPAALDRLKGRTLAILSNGTPAMLGAAVRSGGLDGRFAKVLSADAVRVYKPSPKVYAMVTEAFGLGPGEILFVSSNGWDVAGAASFGFRTCWCNRQKAPREELGVVPDRIVGRLDEI